MIVVTGSKGFIGGALVKRLKEEGYDDIICVDDYETLEEGVHRKDFFRWLSDHSDDVTFIFHLGANTDTLEQSVSVFDEHNLGYSKSVWYKCARHRIPFVYASSAATYGDGSVGYDDRTSPHLLSPLNRYGESKNDFDKFMLDHNHISHPPFWAGLKFFNVYGCDESKKGKMASMIYHAYTQIKQTGKVRLFKDGHQARDFVYVEDVVSVMMWMMKNRCDSGLYNVGTGEARSFKDMAEAVFDALELPKSIEYFNMPPHLRPAYQSFTEAVMDKLRKQGYNQPFATLESGIYNYIQKLEDERKEISAVA